MDTNGDGQARRFLRNSTALALADMNLANAPGGHLDPASRIRGAAPGMSQAIVPHFATFSSLAHTIGQIYRSFDQATYNSRWNSLCMRQDLSVMGPLKARQRAVSLLDWAIRPESRNLPAQKKLCEKMTGILSHTSKFLRYRQWLQEAVWFGRSACQNVYGWDWVNSQKALVVRDWLPVHGDKLVFKFDRSLGIRVPFSAAGSTLRVGQEELQVEMAQDYGYAAFFKPYQRSLMTLHQHEIEDAAYEDGIFAGSVNGIGIRSQIYQTWVLKQETLGALVDFIERVGQGFTILYYDASNPADKAKAEEIAANHDGRRWLLFPRNLGDDKNVTGVERIEPSAAGIDALRVLLDEYFGVQIMQYILGQTATMKAEAQGIGGENIAHQVSFYQVVKFDAINAQESLTTDLLEPLKQFNCPEAKNVNLRLELAVESPKVEQQLKSLKLAYDMGAEVPGRQVCDLVGIAEGNPGELMLVNPEIAAARAQQQQQSQQQAAGGTATTAVGGMLPDGGLAPDPEAQARIAAQTAAVVSRAFGLEPTPEEDAELASMAGGAEQYAADPGFDPRAALRSFKLPAAIRRKALGMAIGSCPTPELGWDGKSVQIPAGTDPGTVPALIAHALAHALAEDHAESPEWEAAWQAEISDGSLSDYAATNPVEGWAEFGRLAWLLPEDARDSYPQAWGVWQAAGLVGDGAEAAQQPGTALVPSGTAQPARYGKGEEPDMQTPNALRATARAYQDAADVEDLKAMVKSQGNELRELRALLIQKDKPTQITIEKGAVQATLETPEVQVDVHVPEQKPPDVKVTVEAAKVDVHVPEQPAPIVQVDVAAPVIHAPVTVQVPEQQKRPERVLTVKRTEDGLRGTIEDAK